MIEGMQNIINILRTPEYPQVRNVLVKYDEDDNIVGKCALGEISCRVGVKIKHDKKQPSYLRILMSAGIPWEWVGVRYLPAFGYVYDEEQKKTILVMNTDSEDEIGLSTWIYTLNDNGFTYDEIADFLETTFQGFEDDAK